MQGVIQKLFHFTSVLTSSIDKTALLYRERGDECRNQMCLATENFAGTAEAVLKDSRENKGKQQRQRNKVKEVIINTIAAYLLTSSPVAQLFPNGAISCQQFPFLCFPPNSSSFLPLLCFSVAFEVIPHLSSLPSLDLLRPLSQWHFDSCTGFG